MAAGKVLDFRSIAFYKELRQYLEMGDRDGAERYLLECERNLEKERQTPLLVAVCNELGALYRSRSMYEASVRAYEKAGSLIEERIGRNSTEYAVLINNMAGTYRQAGQPDRALELFMEALRIYENAGGNSDHDRYACARLHNNMALVYMETGQPGEVIRHLEYALDMMVTVPDRVRESAMICSNLTTLYQCEGDMKSALRYLDRAMELFDRISAEKDSERVSVLTSLAGFLYGAGQYERALGVYRQAAEYEQHFFGETGEYAALCQNMYWVYRKMGKSESAIISLTTAEMVYTDLYGADSERARTVQEELRRITGSKVG